MSTELRRTHTVLDIFRSLAAKNTGNGGLRAGDICERLRELGLPLGTWQVRGELSNLEAAGAIAVDPSTGGWFLAQSNETEAQLKDTA